MCFGSLHTLLSRQPAASSSARRHRGPAPPPLPTFLRCLDSVAVRHETDEAERGTGPTGQHHYSAPSKPSATCGQQQCDAAHWASPTSTTGTERRSRVRNETLVSPPPSLIHITLSGLLSSTLLAAYFFKHLARIPTLVKMSSSFAHSRS